MAAMYAVYHGPEGLKTIAHRVHGLAATFACGLKKLDTVEVQGLPFFDTVRIKCSDSKAIADAAYKKEMNLRVVDSNTVIVVLDNIMITIVLCFHLIVILRNHFIWAFQITISFDETTTLEDVDQLFEVFACGKPVRASIPLMIKCLKLFPLFGCSILSVSYCNCQVTFSAASLAPEVDSLIPTVLIRESPYLTHPIFNK